MMRVLRAIALLLIATTIAVGGVASAGSQAHAATAFPTGSTLVRIDAASASATPLDPGTYRMAFTSAPSVSWMGEVTNANGRQRLRTGTMAPQRLAAKWRALELPRQRTTRATLSWSTSAGTTSFAVVQLSKPARTDAGLLAFDVHSADPLPATMTDVALNIDRATGKATRAFPVQVDYSLSSNLQANTTVHNYATTEVDIVGATTRCYSVTLAQTAPRQSIPNGTTCAGTAFTATTLTMSIAGPATQGSVYLAATMTPQGQAPFMVNSVISTWSFTG